MFQFRTSRKNIGYFPMESSVVLFLLFLFSFGPCTTLDEYSDLRWIAYTPPLRPKLIFVIHQWSQIDPFPSLSGELIGRAMGDISLTIRKGNTVALLCWASYPVCWWKKGEDVRIIPPYVHHLKLPCQQQVVGL